MSVRYRVGYAMEEKKVKTFMVASLVEEAEKKGLDLVAVDPSRPLSDQGTFHCIFHKLHSREWAQQLLLFRGGPVVDPPHLVDLLRDRTTMLHAVSRIQIPPFDLRLPKHYSEDAAEMEFPVIAKPVSSDSHDLVLILNSEGLRRTATAGVVLQEFVNHGGVVFKVYVLGDHVCCVKRPSLPDIGLESVSCSEGGVLPFSRISNTRLSPAGNDELDPRFAPQLAAALRRELGLRLFNVDVIRRSDDPTKHYVIDINYFPGYAKIPNFEPIFTDFLLHLIQNQRQIDAT